MITLLVLMHCDFEVALVSAFVIDIGMNLLEDLLLLSFNVIVEFEYFLSQLLAFRKSFTWPIENDIWNKNVSTSHELIILLNLIVK